MSSNTSNSGEQELHAAQGPPAEQGRDGEQGGPSDEQGGPSDERSLADGSTEMSEDQRNRTESLPDGSGSAATPDSNKDVASGGPAD